MLKITSRENQRIKFAKKVGGGRVKDLIFVEGARLAEELLRSESAITDVLFTEYFRQSERGQLFLEKAAKKTDNFAEVSEKIFHSISDTDNSQGIIIIAAKPATGKNLIEANIQKNEPDCRCLFCFIK